MIVSIGRIYIFENTMTTKRQKTKVIFSWGALLALILLTNPTRLPVPFLVLPFAILFIALYLSLSLLLQKYSRLHPTRIKRTAAVSSSIVIVAFALQSLGQLTIRDVVVAVALIGIGYFYIGRTAIRP
jgi:uncharacterized membrane protein